MSQIFKPGQTVCGESSGMTCKVEQFLGGGGQGEVYRATMSGQRMALKWYFPETATADLRRSLETLVKKGPPNENFLWPMELASAPNVPNFGYLMPLREPRYKSIVDLMKRRVDPTFRALATAGLELSNSFLQLHSKGLCYRDISFDNVFFDPGTGSALICDNDNVDVDGRPGPVKGTPRFMAPEIVRGDALPSSQTDLFSLAVLLFYMLHIHHPLEGKKETAIHSFDLPAMAKLYGTEPVFIFDPQDESNRPQPGYHDNALAYWPIYPRFLRDMFTRAFTDGIRDPQHGRVRESEWRSAMVRLRDCIVYCPHCNLENFYDPDSLKSPGEKEPLCWSCKKEIPIPPRICLGKAVVMLNYDTQIFAHHVEENRLYDFSQPVAAVAQNPSDPGIWGLKNLSTEKWVATAADGTVSEVPPGRSLKLRIGTKINFGKSEGEIRQ
jgi:serine/threonine protein kinase